MAYETHNIVGQKISFKSISDFTLPRNKSSRAVKWSPTTEIAWVGENSWRMKKEMEKKEEKEMANKLILLLKNYRCN